MLSEEERYNNAMIFLGDIVKNNPEVVEVNPAWMENTMGAGILSLEEVCDLSEKYPSLLNHTLVFNNRIGTYRFISR